jgi:hypothetical protein
MQPRILGALTLIALVFTTAAVKAQETSDAVLLRYRFQPGQEFRYRMTLTGDITMTMSGIPQPAGANVPNRIPMTMNGTYEWVQKVKSVSPEGAATVSLGFDKMDLAMRFLGMDMTVHLGPGGKLETLMNGQPMAASGAPAQTIPNPFFEGTIDSLGKLSGVSPSAQKSLSQLFGGQNVAALFNGMPGTGLLLPEKPVRPGDTWEAKADVEMPIPLPGPPGAGGSPAGLSIALGYNFHNKLVRVENGCAVVESQISVTMPGGRKIPVPAGPGIPRGMTMGLERMVQAVTGTQRFGIAEGVIDGSDFDAKMTIVSMLHVPSVSMPARPASTPKAAGKQTRKRSGARQPARGTRSRAPMRRPATPAAPAAGAPINVKIGVDGTRKLQIDRLNAPEEPTPP